MTIHLALILTAFNTSSMRAARVVLALFALRLGAGPFEIGLLAATFSVIPMLLAWPAGRLADRFGSRWPLLVGCAASVLAMVLTYFYPGRPAFFIGALLTGFAGTIYQVGTQNLIGVASTPEQRARNFSNYSLMMAVGNFAGPLAGGVAVDYAGQGLACIWVAGISIAPIVLLLLLGRALALDKRTSAPTGRLFDALAAPGMQRVLVTSGLFQAGMDAFQFYIPVYGRAVALSGSEIGMLLAACGVAAFLVRVYLPSLLAGMAHEKLLAYSLYLAAASLMALPLSGSVLVLAAVSFVFGLGMGCGQPLMTMLIFASSPQGRSGESLGLRYAAINFASLVGPVIFGFLGSTLGLLSVFWASAAMLGSGGKLTAAQAAGRHARDKS